MVLSFSIKYISEEWMWNSFRTHLTNTGKEPATEALKTSLLQHALYL